MNKSIFFFAGSASQVLSAHIAALANKTLGRYELRHFSDGEIRPTLKENLNRATVILIQSTYSPAEHMMELLLMIDAAKNAGAQEIIIVAPYLGYMRQDKIHEAGEAHGAALIYKLLSAAGADQLIVCNSHTKNLTPFFKGAIKQVSTYSLFIPYLESLDLRNMCFVAPDKGALEEAGWYAQYFNTELIACDKIRHKLNQVKIVQVTGNIKDADAIIIDDILDTGHTLTTVTRQLKADGARSVRAICTHPVLSEDAYNFLDKSELEEVIVTNTIPLRYKTAKIKVVDIAHLIYEAINA